MKANEAPKKIFICDYGSEVSYEWHSESEFETKSHNDIEYIRTDAFIEKVCEWLSNISLEDMKYKYDGFDTSEGWYKMIEDFKNYMKGE